jgi:hypothetical protein
MNGCSTLNGVLRNPEYQPPAFTAAAAMQELRGTMPQDTDRKLREKENGSERVEPEKKPVVSR